MRELGRLGMNCYLHAPKEDPFHRERWREPYPEEQLREFAELIEAGSAAGVEVAFGISPGVSIVYGDRADRALLREKLDAFRQLGARRFCLALDDVPTRLVHETDRARFGSLAAAHADLAHEIAEWLGGGDGLWLIPTDYVGTASTPYLETLGRTLDREILIGWTGRTVVPPTIRGEEARARREITGRKLLLWDNVPVADGPMRAALHLAPYRGREPGLEDHVGAVLLNGMSHARSSAVAVATAASFFADPVGYEAEAAWETAIARYGEGAPDAFRAFSYAHRFGAATPEDRDAPLEEAWRVLVKSIPGGDFEGASDRLRRLLDLRLEAARVLRSDLTDRDLLREVEPWIESHHRETERIAAAVELLRATESNAAPMEKLQALFRFQARLRTTTPWEVSYGPRRLLYPSLRRLEDDAVAFGDDPALFRDRCLADECVAFAEDRALELLR